jgi:hypothetical protein
MHVSSNVSFRADTCAALMSRGPCQGRCHGKLPSPSLLQQSIEVVSSQQMKLADYMKLAGGGNSNNGKISNSNR